MPQQIETGYALWVTENLTAFFADEELKLVVANDCGHIVKKRVNNKLIEYLLQGKCMWCELGCGLARERE